MISRRTGTRDFSPSGFFVLRTPLLPFDDLVRWGEGLEDMADPDALEHGRTLLRSRLRDLVSRPDVREAIFVASPTVEPLIDAWIADPDAPRSRECERALVRYFARMAGRSTPFGLFAGVSVGDVADTTRLVLDAPRTYRRTTRLDAGYLVDVVEGLLGDREFREQRTYRPNPSLYRCGERWRYVHSRPGADEQRHRLISVRSTDGLTLALEQAAEGATLAGVRDALVTAGHAHDRASRYVDDLVREQLLVPDVDLQLTGADSTYGLGRVVPQLARVMQELAALDTEELGQPPARYRAIASKLDGLPAEVKPERLFQVDMRRANVDATLGRAVADEILRAVELMHGVSYRRTTETALGRFVERLQERTEGEPVPLLEALDPDLGVGFGDEDPAPAPLLEGLRANATRTAAWGPREDHLLTRLFESNAAGAEELVLDERDLERLQDRDAPPLPDAFAALAIVAARSSEAVDKGRFRVHVPGAAGPSGVRLLGRFCHGDARLQAAVEAHLRTEEALDDDAVFAEIVHLARARDVNVIARPIFRPYEIDCLGGPGVAPEFQIPLPDLRVSTNEGRVTLFSQRLGRRVVPRLTSAHNFDARGMSAYRFLCAVQQQGVGIGNDVWGPLASAPRLPRVRAGRIVLALARWRLDKAVFESGNEFASLQRWRHEQRVPRFVAAFDFGGQLPFDLDNVLAVDALVQSVRSAGSVQLVECFPPVDELCVEGPEGRFAHELVVPFVRSAVARARTAETPSQPSVRRRFAPGGDWVYTRLYTGETIADTLLVDRVSPLVGDLVDSRAADNWFFLRYRDSEFHLRIRFHGDASKLRSAVEELGRRAVDDGLVWRVEFGTYQREAERYGGPEAIDLVESIFHADSDAVVEILPLLEPGDAGLEERWQLGVAGVDELLAALGLDVTDRVALVRRQRDALVRELRWDGAARGRIGQRFRKERAALERLLHAPPAGQHPLDPGLEILRRRSTRIAPVAAELRRLEQAGRLTLSRPEIASSLVHMHLNRLLRGNNGAQEAVVCDFLARLYERPAIGKR